MLSLPPTVRVFVAVEPLDMRGSFDALAGAVRRLGLDPVDGHLYLFLNKRRKIAKALWVRRVRVVCAGEALGGRELSAAAVRRKQAAGRDRRGGVRVAAGRDRLHGGAAWLVSAFSARKALKRIDMERQV